MVQRTTQEIAGHRDDVAQVMYGTDPYGDQGYTQPTSSQGHAYDTIPPGSRYVGEEEANDLFRVKKQHCYKIQTRTVWANEIAT